MPTPYVFILSCDKRIESEVSSLKKELEKLGGENFKIKTFQNVPLPDTKGANFAQKLGNIMRFAKADLIICSENLGAFVDKDKTEYCPDIIKKEKKKDCSGVIQRFLEEESKLFPTKIIVVSVTKGPVASLPKALKGMQIIENTGNEVDFINRIVTEIQGR